MRIHLDQIDGLGCFIEFEAIVDEGPTGLDGAYRRVDELRQAFGLGHDTLVAASYCDLVVELA